MHSSPLDQPGTGDSGGMSVYVRELAGSLARAGLTVDVFVRRTDPREPDVVDVEPGMRVVHLTAGAFDLPKEQLPTILPLFEERLAEWLTQHPVDVLHANYWLSAEVGHRLKHRWADEMGASLPLVLTFHTLGRVKTLNGDAEPDVRVAAERAAAGCADALCAATVAEVDELVDLYGADQSRIDLVAPGVDHAFFSPGDRAAARSALGLSSGPLALFVGRIQPLKGVGIAIEALAHSATADARLVVIGGPSGVDGETELARVQALAHELRVADRVTWIGPQPHHLLSTWYRAADMCVVPSRSESFGLVALEAAACGIPVVATAVGGLMTIVDDARSGFLVDRDPSAFARAMDDVWSDPDRAAQMGRIAAATSRRYSWSSTAGRLRRIYGDLQNAPQLAVCAAGR